MDEFTGHNDPLAVTLAQMSDFDAFSWAGQLFQERDYRRAERVLNHLLDGDLSDPELDSVQELLARTYFHSAQIGRSAELAKQMLDRRPDNAYAALILARSLERDSRFAEADEARRIAVALGAPS